MTERNDGGPAFPREMKAVSFETEGGVGTAVDEGCEGMSLRDWFAGQVAGGFLAATAHPHSSGPADYTAEDLARNAYKAADAMLKEREK